MMNYAKKQRKILNKINKETFENKAQLDKIFKDDPKINETQEE